MSDFLRPTYLETKSRIQADFKLMPAVLREAFAAANAREFHGVYGYLDWIRAQCSPLTCELEMLAVWAALYFVARLDATSATGNVIATGNIGTPLLADTILRGNNGFDYKVLAAVEMVEGDNPVSVRCLGAGAETNLIAGQVLTLVDPVAGIDSNLTVAVAGLNGGAPQENLDAWRVRVVDEWQVVVSRGARSGKVEDYRAWAKRAHPSVTTALVQQHVLGLGTVIVRPICNSLENRLPTPAIITAIEQTLEIYAPAVADWRVTAPIVRLVNFNIDLLPEADTEASRAAITTAIATTIFAETSETAVLAMAEIDAAIATVTTQYTRLAPVTDLAVTAGQVFVMGAIVWG